MNMKTSPASVSIAKRRIMMLCVAMVAVAATIACKSGNTNENVEVTNDCSVVRTEHLTDDEWEIINSNCEYFARLLNAEEKLKSGETLSAGEVQSLMPRNEQDFRQFYILWLYPEDDCNYPNICSLATQYAVEDSLDMMEHVLMWSLWADSWELPWEVAVEIEQKNSAKFYSTVKKIWSKEDIAAWEDYRHGYLEWVADSATMYDQFVYGKSNQ